MVRYPLKFHGEAHATRDIREVWSTSAAQHQTKCSIPEVYEGSGEAFTPEEFFLLSIQNCLVASFKVYADHLKLEYDSIGVSADLIVDIESNQGPVMKAVELNIDLRGCQDRTNAEEIIRKSLNDGFIFNSIKTNVTPKVTYS